MAREGKRDGHPRVPLPVGLGGTRAIVTRNLSAIARKVERCISPWPVPHSLFAYSLTRHSWAIPSVVQRAMLTQSRGPQRTLRYEAGPFKRGIDSAWMVFDERGGRLVAYPLSQHEALTLAHTLNVADLRAPAVDFDHGSRGIPSR